MKISHIFLTVISRTQQRRLMMVLLFAGVSLAVRRGKPILKGLAIQPSFTEEYSDNDFYPVDKSDHLGDPTLSTHKISYTGNSTPISDEKSDDQGSSTDEKIDDRDESSDNRLSLGQRERSKTSSKTSTRYEDEDLTDRAIPAKLNSTRVCKTLSVEERQREIDTVIVIHELSQTTDQEKTEFADTLTETLEAMSEESCLKICLKNTCKSVCCATGCCLGNSEIDYTKILACVSGAGHQVEAMQICAKVTFEIMSLTRVWCTGRGFQKTAAALEKLNETRCFKHVKKHYLAYGITCGSIWFGYSKLLAMILPSTPTNFNGVAANIGDAAIEVTRHLLPFQYKKETCHLDTQVVPDVLLKMALPALMSQGIYNFNQLLGLFVNFHNGMSGEITSFQGAFGKSLTANQHRAIKELLSTGVLSVELYDAKFSAHSPNAKIAIRVGEYATVKKAIAELIAEGQKHFFLELYFDQAMKTDEVVEKGEDGKWGVKQQIFNELFNSAEVRHIRVTKDNLFQSFGSFIGNLFNYKTDDKPIVWTFGEYYETETEVYDAEDLDKDDISGDLQNTLYNTIKTKDPKELPAEILALAKEYFNSTVDPEISSNDPFLAEELHKKSLLRTQYVKPNFTNYLTKYFANADDNCELLEAIKNEEFFPKMMDIAKETIVRVERYTKEVDGKIETMDVAFDKHGKWIDPNAYKGNFRVDHWDQVSQALYTPYRDELREFIREKTTQGVHHVTNGGGIVYHEEDALQVVEGLEKALDERQTAEEELRRRALTNGGGTKNEQGKNDQSSDGVASGSPVDETPDRFDNRLWKSLNIKKVKELLEEDDL